MANQTDVRAYWRMGGITHGAVEDYLYSVLPERDATLRDMEAEAAARSIPIVGPAVGRLLYQLAGMIKAHTVFEMGSAIGYSTIWWARAVGEGGRVIYTDGSRKNADEARRNLERAGVLERVTFHVGDALELLSEQKEPFDIVFNDVDKVDYPRAFRVAAKRVRKGGLFVADNVLWSGKVGQPADKADSETKAILEFNRLLYTSPEFMTTIIPLRDGVAVAWKQ
ncbi:MAG TPA: O-methyltransferase [Terriglobales bacterium]|nr:O-methyltransferase [Terriglobales bacterium]